MLTLPLALIGVTAVCAFASLGGGFYEHLVVDPCWPQRPEIIQPGRGGISRKRFWIPVHVAFEVSLVASLCVTWGEPTVRAALLVALGSHGVMRLWSAFDFIPKALAFERANAVDAAAARRWSRRSMGRLPLSLLTGGALFAALISAARLG